MAAESILQTLQKLATAIHRLDELADDLRELRVAATGKLDKVDSQLADLRERVARLEACREADRSHLQADLARFKAEVERVELRLGRLPESGSDKSSR
jgi:septal ring factor EnvC (AmiA/AmiB activator)